MQTPKRYNVFISYRHSDKEAVHRIARRLSDEAGLEPFVDAWNLIPGDRFTRELAHAVTQSQSVAVFKGPEGMSQWVESETELALSARVRVVPVLLPGATEELPAFLPIRTWVDFRGSVDDPEAFRYLVAGIRGEAPGRPADPKDSRRYHALMLAFVAKDDGYWAEIRGSHIAGHGPVRLQLDPAAMRKRFDFARRPTRTVLRKGMPTKVPDGAALAGVGAELYQLLATSKLGESLENGLRAVDRQHGLGVRLIVNTSKAPALAGLPWEFLSQPESGHSLASSPFTPIMRWFDLDGGLQSLLLARPLRLLVVSAAPSDRPRVALASELAQLKGQLSEATLFETLDHATPESLKDALHRHRPNVLHFVGHGEMKEEGGAIVLEAEDGGANPVTGRGLAVLLENDVPPLQLVFLNSCEGGAISPDDAFGSVAETLVRRHLPAVIAMQFPIPDDAAVALARGFYRDVMEGTPVDAALSSARGVLYADGARFEGFEWGTPALYIRSPGAALRLPVATAAGVVVVLPVGAVSAGAPITPHPVLAPPEGLRIGSGFFADRWVAISGIAAVTASLLTALLIFRPLSTGPSIGDFPSTALPTASARPPALGVPPIDSPAIAGEPPTRPRRPARGVAGGIPGGVVGGVVGGIRGAPPPPPPPPPTGPDRPSSPGSTTSQLGRPPLGVGGGSSSRVAIEAMLGSELHGGSDLSGTAAASLRFREGDELLHPFVRVGVGATARDDEGAWMFVDAGVDVQLSKGFLGAGGGVRTNFDNARGTVFVRGGLDLSATDRFAGAQWILEGRWIQRHDGTSGSDYSLLTGIRIPLGR